MSEKPTIQGYTELLQGYESIEYLVNRFDLDIERTVLTHKELEVLRSLAHQALEPNRFYLRSEVIDRIISITNVSQYRADKGLNLMFEHSILDNKATLLILTNPNVDR